MKIEKMRWHPSVNAGFSTGYPYQLVYAYLPGGIKFIHGTTDEIDKYLRKYKLVHAMEMYCRDKVIGPIKFSLYGKYAYPGENDIYYSLERKNMTVKRRKSIGNEYFLDECDDMKKAVKSHPRYFLIKNKRFGSNDEMICSWRRMPRTYPRIFKEIVGT